MSCQGPDGLKVICKLPDLVNVFTLLGQSVKDIEKSGVLKTKANKDAFHVLFKLSRCSEEALPASRSLKKFNYCEHALEGVVSVYLLSAVRDGLTRARKSQNSRGGLNLGDRR